MVNKQQLLSNAEDIADEVLRHSKHVLPHIARFCLVSTYIEDGVRMWFQWAEQRDFMNGNWNCGWFLGTLFVVLNLFGQLVPCLLILLRKRIAVACCCLAAIIVLQTIAYNIIWDPKFLLRNLALGGGLLLLLVDGRGEAARTAFVGVPSMGDRSPRNYLQLSGRILLILMFTTLLRWEFDVIQIIINLIGWSLMMLVVVGYKTKLSALVLVLLLFIANVLTNPWWMYSTHRAVRDFLKYDFFQTLSVIGGLLLVVTLGPGGVSMDEHKKKW